MCARTAAKSGSAPRPWRVRRQTAAKTTGLPLDKVVVHNHLLGGGFGRRLEVDGVIRAVQIAQHVDGPVKVVWTREEDIQHDMYRPYWFDRISAGLDEKGMPVAWNHRFAGSSVIARWAASVLQKRPRPRHHRRRNRSGVCASEHARRICAGRAAWHSDRLLAQCRAVAQCLCAESFMDELAAAAKQDPVAYRLSSPRQGAPRQSRPRACRGKSRLGTAVA